MCLGGMDELNCLSGYSEKIQKSLTAGSWEDLSEILVQRQKMLEDFFSQLKGMKRDNQSDIAYLIKKIQQEDEVFLKLLVAQKQGLEKQFISLKQSRKSVKAYQG